MEDSNHPYVNEVLLVGRLSKEPLVKTLTSGDQVLTWRLIVDRPSATWRTPRRVVDTFNCMSFDERLFDPAPGWRAGDLLEVRGTLRRRFWPDGSQYMIIAHHAEPRPQPTEEEGG